MWKRLLVCFWLSVVLLSVSCWGEEEYQELTDQEIAERLIQENENLQKVIENLRSRVTGLMIQLETSETLSKRLLEEQALWKVDYEKQRNQYEEVIGLLKSSVVGLEKEMDRIRTERDIALVVSAILAVLGIVSATF